MRAHLISLAAVAALALGGCSSPRTLVPNTTEGPTSYVCFASGWSLSMDEVKAAATRQCAAYGMQVTRFIGTSFAPMKCGLLTPEVAAYACGQGGGFMPR
ncbi:hypothetical protein [Magnetospirillum sp. SS-4]|uniref:hypothetical protein n=1 Tax=Magnetospirillum sp. SS-4 TaxID=2681465 RepID=UPI00137CE13D|nr:hypothetical protein [Magnetospirillum sp. SS-4]CAA7616230.1 conserved exported hypothetical protein [Magnetospirillum sp. SS-4]